MNDPFDFEMTQKDRKLVRTLAKSIRKQQLEEDGYAIIDKTLLKGELDFANHLFEGSISSVCVNDDVITPSMRLSKHKLAHHPFAWYIRARPKVLNYFKVFHKKQKLVSSFSCPRYWPANRPHTFYEDVGFHTDQDPNSDVNGYCGYVSLTTNYKTGFKIIPGSHKRHSEIKDYYSYKGWGNACGHLDLVKSESKEIYLKAGQMLLYDSRLVYSFIHSDEHTLWQPVSYYPEESSNARNAAFVFGLGTENFPFPFKAADPEISTNDLNYFGLEKEIENLL